MKYRKREGVWGAVVDAMQLPARDVDVSEELLEFMDTAEEGSMFSGHDQTLEIHKPDEVLVGNPGDWLIRDAEGQFEPCTPEVFEATYALIEDEPDED